MIKAKKNDHSKEEDVISSTNKLQTEVQSKMENINENMYMKRQIKVKTCADVYEQWRTCKRLYKKAPKDGVEFLIDYIDTGLALPEEVREKAPIVLVLHGAPGSYQDFALLIQHLRSENVRVIAPNFPLYKETVQASMFRHSGDEKAAYLRDFLRAINITKIDLLVSHSSAIFPTLLILLNANKNKTTKNQKDQQQSTNHQQQLKIQSLGDELNKTKIFDSEEEQLKNFELKKVGQIRQNLTDDEEDEVDDDDDDHEDDEAFVDAQAELEPEVGNAGPKHVDVNNNNRKKKKFDGDKLTTIEERDDNGGQSATAAAPATEVDDLINQKTHVDAEQAGDDKAVERAREIRKKLKREAKTRKKTRDAPPVVKFEETIQINAVALFNPAGHRLPKSMKPTWFKCGSVHCYQHKIGRYWFRKLGPAFLTIVGVPVKVDNMDNVMLSATVMRNSKCGRVMSQLEELSQLKVPTLLVFSENDKLIEKEIFYEMTQFMNLNPKTFDIFNNEGLIEKSQSRTDDWIRVMVFKAGGHYAYSNYAKTVNQAVSELLAKTTSSSPTTEILSNK